LPSNYLPDSHLMIGYLKISAWSQSRWWSYRTCYRDIYIFGSDAYFFGFCHRGRAVDYSMHVVSKATDAPLHGIEQHHLTRYLSLYMRLPSLLTSPIRSRFERRSYHGQYLEVVPTGRDPFSRSYTLPWRLEQVGR
jgi:hypothetical protein